ncbi:hypothetical protein K493DRAFT_354216 [Basidiobolus meristosporus CBS 931.73]|uniref:Uncharacterized protein n=1 Tax=Basidiobolus meristosporus CBS 931.73 TaxID=1314790 RepID=A0A1Y1Y3U1_9FUNG|nr:hypothetical protein K493DRAFT_354216 [Basidiobolus meristosporus CBS 931.73]|eukprot:ORX92653.1 hypothetical protein K493DRAFT_354216 [Basidiobolus meristosporus CBS 931.73]
MFRTLLIALLITGVLGGGQVYVLYEDDSNEILHGKFGKCHSIGRNLKFASVTTYGKGVNLFPNNNCINRDAIRLDDERSRKEFEKPAYIGSLQYFEV